MKVSPIFAWHDLWVGACWDRDKKKLCVLPFPTLGIVFDFKKPELYQPIGPADPPGKCGGQVP